MLLLTLSLGVTGFGIATAVYLERPPPSVTGGRAPIPAALPMPSHDPLAAAAAVPLPAETPPAPAALPAIEPQAGPPAPPPQTGPSVQAAALESPPPAVVLAPAAETKASYWVEYGAFLGEASALRLKEALGRHGLVATIVTTHGRDGRKLLSVRSTPLADRADARRAIGEARRALRIAALLHRDNRAAAPAPQFRVQFGAFAKPGPAARLSRELASGGIATTVSSVQEANGKLLYLVQTMPVPDHAQALALGERGRQIAQTDFRIERTRHPAAASHRAPRPPPHLADSQ
jgi:cell division septation protein DedD